jgi:hypothetical protein
MSGNFPTIDLTSDFYLGCKKKRETGEKLCTICPFRAEIERLESTSIDPEDISDSIEKEQ